MNAPTPPRTADDIAKAMMSAFRHDMETAMAIYSSDHAGIVKLYQQDKWLKLVRSWLESDPSSKARFDSFVARQKQGGQ